MGFDGKAHSKQEVKNSAGSKLKSKQLKCALLRSGIRWRGARKIFFRLILAMNLQKKERVDKDFFSMTFYLDELFDIFLSPFYPVYTMCGHFLPLILLAALAVFFWPALGCENWPGKINLSCLFSFFLFNNGNYHQDYLAQRFLLVLVLVVLALTDKFISETCKIENVCRRNILSCIANCHTGNSSSS